MLHMHMFVQTVYLVKEQSNITALKCYEKSRENGKTWLGFSKVCAELIPGFSTENVSLALGLTGRTRAVMVIACFSLCFTFLLPLAWPCMISIWVWQKPYMALLPSIVQAWSLRQWQMPCLADWQSCAVASARSSSMILLESVIPQKCFVDTSWTIQT